MLAAIVRPFHVGVPRWGRVVALTATGVLVLAVAFEVWTGVHYNGWTNDLGGDFLGYVTAARSWLAGDGFYLARQLHGPYPIHLHDVLYPPTTLWLFVPFTVLPAILWWVLAVGLLAYVVVGWRPALWTWPLMALCLVFQVTPLMYLRGSPVIMVAALVAAGLRWGWPGALVLLKPSDLPFALIGVRTRGWWLTVGLLVLLTLPVLGLIPDWLHAMSDAQPGGLLYSIRDVPLLLAPITAWLGRSRGLAQA